MTGFSQDTLLIRTADGRNADIVDGFVFGRPSGELVTVPPTTGVTDGLSAPSFIWDVMPPFGWYWKAAVLHDYLYRFTQRAKAECDQILLEALEFLANQAPNVFERDKRLIEAHTFHEAVALGGEKAFSDDRKQQGGNQ